MRSFAGVGLGQEGAPDKTAVCKFRHLLERRKLGKKLLSTVNRYLARNGIKISKGTIVDATIISALASKKNKDGKRDPEMVHRLQVTAALANLFTCGAGCWQLSRGVSERRPVGAIVAGPPPKHGDGEVQTALVPLSSTDLDAVSIIFTG